jgi:hypothetical protein
VEKFKKQPPLNIFEHYEKHFQEIGSLVTKYYKKIELSIFGEERAED